MFADLGFQGADPPIMGGKRAVDCCNLLVVIGGLASAETERCQSDHADRNPSGVIGDHVPDSLLSLAAPA